MRSIRIGKPTITPLGIRLIAGALQEGRASEGILTDQLESTLAAILGVRHAIAVNSGHSALVLAYQAARDMRGVDEIVTTPITFISTVSAALALGLKVTCVDAEGCLANSGQAKEYLEAHPNAAWVPVHLFGYQCEDLLTVGHRFIIEDACEAFGSTRMVGRQRLGTDGHIGCFSFYTSHVLGAGEMGLLATDDNDIANLIRRLKDQGRTYLRHSDHQERMTSCPPSDRYHHAFLGWNFRTTDLQAALLLGSIPELPRVVQRRRDIVSGLNDRLERLKDQIALPVWYHNVSYLAYPIICKTPELRNRLMEGLDRRGVETRPLMSYLPEELALRDRLNTPYGTDKARDIHQRGLYISAHDSLTDSDLDYIKDTFEELIG